MKTKLKEFQDSIEPIEDFKKHSLRESKRNEFYNCVPYDQFKILLEKLLKKYNDVITDYSIDIKNNIYIQCDLELKKQDKLKNFYTEFRNLLKDERYYIMSYIEKIGDSFKEHLKNISFETFIKSDILRIYIDKIYDIPIEIQNLKTHYGTKVIYLYHVTYKDIYEKEIRKNGLIPTKKEMVSHEPKGKVYFFTNKEDCYKFIREKKRYEQTKESLFNDEYFSYLENHYNEFQKYNYSIEYKKLFENINYDKFVILKIDIHSVGPIKIYKDRKETERDAYYTYDSIPYWSIKLEEDNL